MLSGLSRRSLGEGGLIYLCSELRFGNPHSFCILDCRSKAKRLATSTISIRQALRIASLAQEKPSKFAILVADFRDRDLINQHVVALSDVVNVNLRIFLDLRSFDHFSI
jgi:hypothetical protein